MKKKEFIGQHWERQPDGSWVKKGGVKVDTPEDVTFSQAIRIVADALVICAILFVFLLMKGV
ncbi:MAG: hypothetical protein MJ097_00575 [Dorea sp.]|nr:hypothetical protein [Dorea sp.]